MSEVPMELVGSVSVPTRAAVPQLERPDRLTLMADDPKGSFTATSTLTCPDALGEARPPWRSPSCTYC